MLMRAVKCNGEEVFIDGNDIYVIRKKTADGVVNEVMTIETNEYLGRIDDDELKIWADRVSSYNHARTAKLLNIEDDGR